MIYYKNQLRITTHDVIKKFAIKIPSITIKVFNKSIECGKIQAISIEKIDIMIKILTEIEKYLSVFIIILFLYVNLF